jgi:uncharacterized protein (DUF58 family)
MPAAPPRPGRRRPDLLGPEELVALGGLEVLASRVVDGFLLGLHRSPRRGLSAEFAELRAYRPGDDLRHVDWRMVGRSDRFYVKQYEEDTHLGAYLLLDVSGSMGWSSRPGTLPPKLWYGQLLSAALALLLIRQGDRVGFAPFDRSVRDWLPARGGRRHQGELLRRIADQEARGETEAGEPLREAALRLRRPGMVILVSDLLLDPEGTARALRYLSHRGHQVLVLHLLDPGERDLSGTGTRRFRDPESGQELRVSVPDIRSAYRDAVDQALRSWRAALRPAGVDYHVVDTGSPFGPALRQVLRARARR